MITTANEMDHPKNASSVITPEIVTVSYDDLIAFDQNYEASVHSPDDTTPTSASSSSSWQRIPQRIAHDAFGPNGLGIVLVRHVPNFTTYRTALLPLAAQIPNLPPHVQDLCTDPASCYQVGWSHGKEILSSTTRQPDTNKGSYYANPLTNDLLRTLEERNSGGDDDPTPRHGPQWYTNNKWPPAPHLPQLEPAFCQMGQLLHSVGCIIAQVCDVYCCSVVVVGGGGGGDVHPDARTRLAPTLIRSQNANGRLLHYFPVPTTTTHNTSTLPPPTWCSWHNDHGLLTGLVPGMYIDTRTGVDVTDQIHDIHNDHGGDRGGGLYIQARNGQCVRVSIPVDCCAFQIGETAQILSGGLLRATPHAVFPPAAPAVSRESFALFLEPEFEEVLVVPSSRSIEECCGSDDSTTRLGLRSISERYQVGQTFGDFHLATVSANTESSSD